MFSQTLFQQHLQTQTLGRNLVYVQEVDSTNTRAWELVAIGSPDGTVVLTDYQRAGRGRGDHPWWSTPGRGLTFSIILKPEISIQTAAWFSLLAGVTVAETLNKLALPARLKWPNDILLKGKKLGGILCETRIQGRIIQAVVMGIGLNINETSEDFRAQNLLTATSLLRFADHPFSREKILGEIMNRLEPSLNQFYRSGPQNVEERWLVSCHHLNRTVTAKRGSETLQGVFTGLGPRGEAQLEIGGENVLFNAGEIRHFSTG